MAVFRRTQSSAGPFRGVLFEDRLTGHLLAAGTVAMNSTGTRKQKMKRARTDMSSIQNRVSDALLGALADLEALSPPVP